MSYFSELLSESNSRHHHHHYFYSTFYFLFKISKGFLIGQSKLFMKKYVQMYIH